MVVNVPEANPHINPGPRSNWSCSRAPFVSVEVDGDESSSLLLVLVTSCDRDWLGTASFPMLHHIRSQVGSIWRSNDEEVTLRRPRGRRLSWAFLSIFSVKFEKTTRHENNSKPQAQRMNAIVYRDSSRHSLLFAYSLHAAVGTSQNRFLPFDGPSFAWLPFTTTTSSRTNLPHHTTMRLYIVPPSYRLVRCVRSKQASKQASKQTNKQANKQTNKQANKQTNQQSYAHS